jgi:hypothetical protein
MTAHNSSFVKKRLNSYLSAIINNQQQNKSEAIVFQIPLLHKAVNRSAVIVKRHPT